MDAFFKKFIDDTGLYFAVQTAFILEILLPQLFYIGVCYHAWLTWGNFYLFVYDLFKYKALTKKAEATQ